MVIVLIVVIALVGQKAGTNAPGSMPGNNAAGGGSAQTSTQPVSQTRSAAPTGVVVPNAGAQNAPAGVAVPQSQSPAAPGATAQYRSYNITVDGNAFTPSTIAFNQVDTVNLKITAQGGNYDFTQSDFGLSAVLSDGKSKTVQFQASASGKFEFYCASCGGPSKGPVGYLIVAPK